MAEYIAKPTQQDVERIVRREFPPEVVGEVFQALRSIRGNALAARIQAVCLRISQRYVATLKKELAESDRSLFHILRTEASWDRQQYEAWLYHSGKGHE